MSAPGIVLTELHTGDAVITVRLTHHEDEDPETAMPATGHAGHSHPALANLVLHRSCWQCRARLAWIRRQLADWQP